MSTEPSAVAGHRDQSIGRGIACIIAAIFLLSICDAMAKWLGHAGYQAFQIVFFRYLFGLLPVAVFVWRSGPGSLRSRRPIAHALRACLMFGALASFFAGLRVLPLAEAVAVTFTAPLFVTALSGPLLREPVGPRRWAAVLVGFVGALVVLRPGTEAFRPESLLALCAALCFALAMIMTRWMARSETNVAVLAYSTLGAGIACLPFLSFVWRPVEAAHLWIFLALGILGGIGANFMISAYRQAPAAVIAPFDYTALIWTALLGWFLFQDKPDALVWLGAAIIVASGLYIMQRESAMRRAAES